MGGPARVAQPEGTAAHWPAQSQEKPRSAPPPSPLFTLRMIESQPSFSLLLKIKIKIPREKAEPVPK
jgi:hypothetical protein